MPCALSWSPEPFDAGFLPREGFEQSVKLIQQEDYREKSNNNQHFEFDSDFLWFSLGANADRTVVCDSF